MDVAITIPNERRYLDVARLVFGGAASRLDMRFDDVDDVQLALESILTAGLCRGDEVTLDLRTGETEIAIWVGPLDEEALEARLDETGAGLPLSRLLEQLVDVAQSITRDGAAGLLLVKRLRVAEGP